MNFFQSIVDLQIAGDWKINIKQDKDNNMIVSVLLFNDSIGDKAKTKVPPLTLSGTAEQLDKCFFNVVSEPIIKTAELFTNMENYLKELDIVKRQSQMETDKKNKEKQAQDERKKKYTELMKKVDELDEKKQYQLAISALPKAELFPEQKDDIEKRLEELRKKNGQASLF